MEPCASNGATCFVPGCQKRPGRKRGWAHTSDLKKGILACLGLSVSESFVTASLLAASFLEVKLCNFESFGYTLNATLL